jgi:hypothetical protein
LTAEIADNPRRVPRSVDVAVGGIMARLADAGITGTTPDPADRARRSLATFGCAFAVFWVFAASIWSHLMIARRWSQPATFATHTAIVIMTIALFGGAAVAVVGSLPIAF